MLRELMCEACAGRASLIDQVRDEQRESTPIGACCESFDGGVLLISFRLSNALWTCRLGAFRAQIYETLLDGVIIRNPDCHA